MPRWSWDFSLAAEKDLAKLDRHTRRRIIDKLDWLAEHFNEIIPTLLHGDFREFYKLRVGDWRVAYVIKLKIRILPVCYIDRRDKIYRV